MDGFDIAMNFNWLTERLAVGSRPRTETDLVALGHVGVTHLLDVCEFDDTALLSGLSWAKLTPPLKYLWNPSRDDGNPKPADWFMRSIIFGLDALGPLPSKLYVHCFDGINRGPSTAYAIMRAWGLERTDARLILMVKRPIAIARYARDADLAMLELRPAAES